MNSAALTAHLGTGVTHVCRCWRITRRDGVALGFTDHDRALGFDGLVYAPHSGLSARALASTTGLSINNTEAIGVISDAAITETDLNAGRYDGAEVVIWLVVWDDPAARQILFRGTIGEITRAGGGFQAELNGLTEALNQPQGRSYLTKCTAVLGDGQCRFVTAAPAFHCDHTLGADMDGQFFRLAGLPAFAPQWFEGGQLVVLTGAAQGAAAVIKADISQPDFRQITLWAPVAHGLRAGDRIRLIAGCDKRAETCRTKFGNLLNFQGFPDIPGDDWLVSVPRSGQSNTGGSLKR